MVPLTHTAIKNKTIEEYLETLQDDCHIIFGEKCYKKYIEYDFILDKRYV